ncbi:hypothetical protein B566_EDAN015557 [Ephemera danica]|nr:hypothetical protein B566_EDAN015557 [Ephemera danica]
MTHRDSMRDTERQYDIPRQYERHTHRDSMRERHTESATERQYDTPRQYEKETHRDSMRERHTERQYERHRETYEKETHRDSMRERHTERQYESATERQYDTPGKSTRFPHAYTTQTDRRCAVQSTGIPRRLAGLNAQKKYTSDATSDGGLDAPDIHYVITGAKCEHVFSLYELAV